jgi:hypothetical protein
VRSTIKEDRGIQAVDQGAAFPLGTKGSGTVSGKTIAHEGDGFLDGRRSSGNGHGGYAGDLSVEPEYGQVRPRIFMIVRMYSNGRSAIGFFRVLVENKINGFDQLKGGLGCEHTMRGG